MKRIKINKNKFKHGSLAWLSVLIFLTALILLNVVFSALNDRFSLKLDLTANKIFSVSDATKEFLENLDEDVTITVFAEESQISNSTTYYKQIAETINTYERLSDNIAVEYLDPDKNPQLISEFQELYSGDLSTKALVVKSGDRIRALGESDLLDVSSFYTTGEYKINSQAEQAITSAIAFVTEDETISVAVMGGETADDITGFKQILTDNNYELIEVDPLTGEIPETASAVLVACPLNDYTAQQIARLKKFLDSGNKTMIYVASVYQNAAPNLKALIAEYGMTIEDGYVLDTDPSKLVALDADFYAVYSFPPSNEFSKKVQNEELPVIIPYAQPITLDTEKAESLLDTSETSIIIDAASLEEDFDINSLPKGARSVIAMGKKGESKAVVISSALMLNSALTSVSAYNNGEYPLSIINGLTGKTASISIVAKDLTLAPLEVTVAQTKALQIVAMYVIPLILLAAGIVVWIKRRNR